MSKHIWMSLRAQGRSKVYYFNVWAPEKYLDEWRGQGLEINPLVNIIPKRVADLGLTKIWCFLQNIGLIRLV